MTTSLGKRMSRHEEGTTAKPWWPAGDDTRVKMPDGTEKGSPMVTRRSAVGDLYQTRLIKKHNVLRRNLGEMLMKDGYSPSLEHLLNATLTTINVILTLL